MHPRQRYAASLTGMSGGELVGEHEKVAAQAARMPIGHELRDTTQDMLALVRTELLNRLEPNHADLTLLDEPPLLLVYDDDAALLLLWPTFGGGTTLAELPDTDEPAWSAL